MRLARQLLVRTDSGQYACAAKSAYGGKGRNFPSNPAVCSDFLATCSSSFSFYQEASETFHWCNVVVKQHSSNPDGDEYYCDSFCIDGTSVAVGKVYSLG